MAATTFSVDTPLYVTGVVARRGIAGNWEWWAFALSHVLLIYIFARLWRRAEVVTDVELTELRYGGLKAWDADGVSLDARMLPSPDGLAQALVGRLAAGSASMAMTGCPA